MKLSKPCNWFPIPVIASLPVLLFVRAALPDSSVYGISQGSPLINRLTFHFVHGGYIHLLLNWWCLTNVSMLYFTQWYDPVVCLLLASTYPFCSSQPIVGLSAFIYAYIGLIVCHNQNSEWWRSWIYIISFILITGLLPRMGIGIHLWTFTLGSLYGLAKHYFS